MHLFTKHAPTEFHELLAGFTADIADLSGYNYLRLRKDFVLFLRKHFMSHPEATHTNHKCCRIASSQQRNGYYTIAMANVVEEGTII